MIKNLTDFISKQLPARGMNGVLVKPDRIVATDSFKLIELKMESDIKKPILLNLPNGVNKFSKILKLEKDWYVENGNALYKATEMKDDFPKYEQIIPKDKPVFKIRLSPLHLKAICTAFEDKESMDIEFHGEMKVVVCTDKDKTLMTLLMPINPDR